MFRSHGTDTPREIWRFGNPGDPMYDTLVKFLRLRYQLMPYIYSLAGQIAHEDYTMIRALSFDFRGDAATYNISDQFMFGPALLVNPVTKPMYYGPNSTPITCAEKTRPVYLPTGSDWYDFWTGERYAGGQTLNAHAGLGTMPLYVRAGSLIPFGPDISHTDEQPQAMVKLRIYPGRDGVFTLYQDEGDNYNYEKGLFATIQLRWKDKDSRLIFEKRQGNYPGMSDTLEFSISVVGETFECQVVYAGTQKIVNFIKS
jgi:alpha-D-xyloside xylohydrolase